MLCKHVHAVVAGSVFVNILLNASKSPSAQGGNIDFAPAIDQIEAKAKELSGL